MTHTSPRTIGIASGKGGVGKTTLAVNVASAMAALGRRVVLLDADLGLANSQILLGLNTPLTISQVLQGECALEDILVRAGPHLTLIPGASGSRKLGSLQHQELSTIIQAVSSLAQPVDELIVDIASGLSTTVITTLRACQHRCIVIRDEPASIADAYGMIKVMAEDGPLDSVYLLPNMMRDHAAGLSLHQRFNKVCMLFLNQPVKLAGVITDDQDRVRASHRRRIPFVNEAPGSLISRNVEAFAQFLLAQPERPAHGGMEFFAERLFLPSAEGTSDHA